MKYLLYYILFFINFCIAQNETCFNCEVTGCKNFGKCLENKQCQCPAGFGDKDCMNPLCGGLTAQALTRPILPLNPINGSSGCICTGNWTGQNCNVCQQDYVCQTFAVLGTTQLCQKTPVAWGPRHYSTCSLDNSFLRENYAGYHIGLTIERNAIENTMTYNGWLLSFPQFTCISKNCTQSYDDGLISSTTSCLSTNCTCRSGAAMCKSPSGFLDLSVYFENAAGKSSLSCADTKSCVLKADYLNVFFDKGIIVTNCTMGECVNSEGRPGRLAIEAAPIDTVGIVAISIFSFIIFSSIVVLALACYQRKLVRESPIPEEYPGASLEFKNITYEIPSKDSVKEILHGISGSVAPGQLLAIMGPSGSGKTTFLDILARKEKSGKMGGELLVNDTAMNLRLFKKVTGYVDQEDIHFPTLTVREVLNFSAAVRLHEAVNEETRTEIVENVMTQLGLRHIAESRVGDAIHRGLSGGEKKRLSIAIELVTNPAILFVDEPTSGLDSFSAVQTIQALSKLAVESKKTIICTVHQPNSAIFNLFDQVLLIAKGKTIYLGPAKDAESFCHNIGNPCPSHSHIADHLLDVAVKIDVNTPSYVQTPEKGPGMISTMKISKSNDKAAKLNTTKTGDGEEYGTSTLTQCQYVIGRSFKVFVRAPNLFWAHLGLSLFSGFFIGFVYFQIDNSIGGFQNRLGSFLFILCILGFGGLSAIASISNDKLLFIRERSNGFYSFFPYFLSKVLFDLFPLRILPAIIISVIMYPLCGYVSNPVNYFKYVVILTIFNICSGLHGFLLACLIPDPATSTLTAVMSIMFQLLFSGVFLNLTTAPKWIGWIQYLSFFKYAFEALIANEASGISIRTYLGGIELAIPASTLLNTFGLDSTAYYRDMAVLLGLSVALTIGTAYLMNVKLREKK